MDSKIAFPWGLLLGLTMGNFIWQAFGAKDWSVALDRSYFQAGAVAAFYFGIKTKNGPFEVS